MQMVDPYNGAASQDDDDLQRQMVRQQLRGAPAPPASAGAFRAMPTGGGLQMTAERRPDSAMPVAGAMPDATGKPLGPGDTIVGHPTVGYGLALDATGNPPRTAQPRGNFWTNALSGIDSAMSMVRPPKPGAGAMDRVTSMLPAEPRTATRSGSAGMKFAGQGVHALGSVLGGSNNPENEALLRSEGKRALVDQRLSGNAPGTAPSSGSPFGRIKSMVARGTATSPEGSPAPTGPVESMAAGAGELGSRLREAAGAPAMKSSGFQSENASPQGFAQEYVASIAPQIRAIPIGSDGDESARRAKTEELIRAIVPDLQARGVNVQDVRNEKILVDGQWIDLIQDVSGAVNPQWAVVDEGAAGAPSGQPMGEGPSAASSLAPLDWGSHDRLAAKLREILGGDAGLEREALMRRMER